MKKHNSNKNGVILAAKAAPETKLLSDISRAGIIATELYLSAQIMNNVKHIIKICRGFPLRYSLHAPVDDYDPQALAMLADGIKAEAVVFHNIYWEDEWVNIIGSFENLPVKLCVENTYSLHEASKFNRRFGLGWCLDLEHLQMECCGVYEEEFIKAIGKASYIHLTGYKFGSELWHTHLHRSKQHSRYMLGLIEKAGYKGFVVSEAGCSWQNYREFRKLSDFFVKWRFE